MAEAKFRLPRSSYDQIARIIQAYANFTNGAPLADVARVAVTDTETVSRNNGFLADVGLVAGGNRKALTDLGRDLARALEYDTREDVRRLWREVISETPFLRGVLSAVRIRRGMEVSTLQTHIAYSASLPKSARVMVGASCVIEILQVAELLREEDGTLIAVPAEDVESRDVSISPESTPELTQETPTISRLVRDVETTIQIQIQVQCSPDELEQVGQKLHDLLDELGRSSGSE
jgi:hypothetical protein